MIIRTAAERLSIGSNPCSAMGPCGGVEEARANVARRLEEERAFEDEETRKREVAEEKERAAIRIQNQQRIRKARAIRKRKEKLMYGIRSGSKTVMSGASQIGIAGLHASKKARDVSAAAFKPLTGCTAIECKSNRGV